ncbi:PREDICTED: uncharacterized protein LOC109583688, partial [Amphimedon queenslandica]|uniref:Death domain-containing protein n=1 Tax=Amphimedon queenslandica TaxID=400682 RepID=A0AAN0JCF6_AMPQE
VSQGKIDDYGSKSPPDFPGCTIEITAEPGEGADRLIYPVPLRGIKSDNMELNIVLKTDIETLTDTLLDIRDLVTVLQELTSNQQFDYANNWKQLGLYLGLYQPTLKAIEVNCRGQVKECLMECLSSWLKGEDGVRETRGGGSNWISLVAALDAMGEREVADNIRIKYNL